MTELEHKRVLVLGLDPRGEAAAALLCRLGARVIAAEADLAPESAAAAARLRDVGVEVLLKVTALPSDAFALVVVSPAVEPANPLLAAVRQQRLRVISELELGFQCSKCLTIAISGTNGKSTTAGLIERILLANGRKAVVAGHRARPLCSVVEQTRDLDFLVLQVSSVQLETIEVFRPAVAVLLNLASAQHQRYAAPADYVRAGAALFRNQQPFDWAIVQTNALARVRELELPLPGKLISFSAAEPTADLYLDRGLLVSRLANWSGPLLDMDHCRLRGPHNAENLMAALAVGHALRLPLENMAEPLNTFTAGPHHCEPVAELNGVQFINDAKSCNVEALQGALLTAYTGPSEKANILLIAGGRDSGMDFHQLGPLLSRRVKRAFLFGEAGEKIRAAWSLFTPCIVTDSLLEAVTEAAKYATSGDVVLLSPACSSLDQFRHYEQRGEVFKQAVKSISGGALAGTHHMHGQNAGAAE